MIFINLFMNKGIYLLNQDLLLNVIEYGNSINKNAKLQKVQFYLQLVEENYQKV